MDNSKLTENDDSKLQDSTKPTKNDTIKTKYDLHKIVDSKVKSLKGIFIIAYKYWIFAQIFILEVSKTKYQTERPKYEN